MKKVAMTLLFFGGLIAVVSWLAQSSGGRDVLQGNWRRIRGTVRNEWGKLTEDDLESVGGNAERLLGLLQERYGWTKEYAQERLDTFLRTSANA